MSLELKFTKDGSFTLWNSQLEETYHSIHGARQEAIHVFLRNGLLQLKKPSIKILEVGLGTGFNAMLSYLANTSLNIYYTGLEPFPVGEEILKLYIQKNSLNEKEEEIWKSLMLGDEMVNLPNFTLQKVGSELMNFNASQQFDLIYFDAFAPNKQQEMWSPNVFKHLFELSKSNTRLVTYCAQGQFKRNLKAAGFRVLSLPGPPRKREMTVGIKP